jgi:hypothetical protein
MVLPMVVGRMLTKGVVGAAQHQSLNWYSTLLSLYYSNLVVVYGLH